jgi:diamine N-acetyltransferase
MIVLREITAKNALPIMRLSKTLSKPERKNVADNSVSIAQGSLSEHSLMRAVVLIDHQGETYIGFVMLHIGSSKDDGIDVEGPYLWRLMIASFYQSKGYGKAVLDQIIEMLHKDGYRFLKTSVSLGEKSPLDFYLNYGFKKIDESFGDEQGLIYQWE